jgi:aminoglycoside phosphotransferase (APT) family kinase protein
MRFGAYLATMDDIDILPAAIAHLRRIGVSTIVVEDYGSTDGSLDVLAEAETRGDVWVLHPTAEDPYEVWDGINVALSRTLGVDWMLFVDADEFWLPASGSLHDLGELSVADVVTVRRYNVALGPDGPLLPGDLPADAYDEVWLYGRPAGGMFLRLREGDDVPWIGGQLEPKILVRPDAVRRIHNGDHGVDCGDGCRKAIARDVIIAHVPFRSLAQFERKALNYQRAIEAFPEWYAEFQGWQWVRWARQLAEGRLGEEWARQMLDGAELERLRADGTLRSAAAMLERLIPPFPDEAAYDAAVEGPEPWVSAAAEVCRREGIGADIAIRHLPGGLYPAVRMAGHVVKLYGPWRDGAGARRAELAALRAVASDPELPVPRLEGQGALDEDWEYLVETLVPGEPLSEARATLGPDARADVATWLGGFVRRLHAVPLDPARAAAAARDFAAFSAMRRARAVATWGEGERLPGHLVAQLEAWLPGADELAVPEGGAVLLHADLHDEHVLGRAEEGRFVPEGVIDLNRARIGHPLYELGPIWRWALEGDPRLVAAFLAAADLPGSGEPGFPRLALAWCLLHEGVGQYPLDLPALADAATLDELAERAFGA